MEVFKIKPGSFEEIRKKRLRRGIPPLILAALAGMAISFFKPEESGNGNSIIILLIMIPVFTIVIIWSINKGIKRGRMLFESSVIEIDNVEITRMMQDTPVIRIALSDIKEIGKNPKNEIVIKGKSAQDIITIPPQVENRERLETLLNEIKPMGNSVSVSFVQKYNTIISLVSIGSFTAVIISENKTVVALCGTISLLILGYSFFSIRKNKNLDIKAKRFSYFMLIIMYSVIGVMYRKLST